MATKRTATTRPASALSLLSARGVAKAAGQRLLRQRGFRDPAAALASIHRLYQDDHQRQQLRPIFTHLLQACRASADPDRALVNFERLGAALPNAAMLFRYLRDAPARLDELITIFAHSQALADTLTRDAKLFHFLVAPEMLDRPRNKAWMNAELRRWLLPGRGPAERYDVIRRFRRRETLRIGARDLLGRATVEETTLELSNLADVCLQAVYESALEKVGAALRLPPAQVAAVTGSDAGFVVIGMGKLGGQELNYSSDVDVIFVYGAEGEFSPRLNYHQFYTKLAGEFIEAVGHAGPGGTIFRIDLRLRPEGASGPLVQSLDGCENYYAAAGEPWERMALVKARPVAGHAGVGAAFLEMVRPFVYRRHMGENVIRQMAALKERIEQEIVGPDSLTRHVKLGIGGIREIEFTIQSFQVLRGARLPALRERNSLRALDRLVAAKLFPAADARRLAAAYRFLRNVEHRLQMELELQTHTIPDEARAQYRLARSLGFASVAAFEKVQRQHTANVRAVYSGVLADAATHTAAPLTPAQLPALLEPVGLADDAAARQVITQLWEGPGFVHVSQRTRDLFAQLLPALLGCLARVPDPDTALTRFERFITAYGSRGLLYELFARNTRLVEMLVRLGDASRSLSESLAQQPELFDEVCRGVALSEPKHPAEMWAELTALAADADLTARMDVAREWKRAELLRIGIEDVMGLVDTEQALQELSRLGEACLRFALESLLANGHAGCRPFAIIGLGKFGGQELGYGSDLDVLFVTGNDVDQARAARLATELMQFMKRGTAAGALFEVDPRLRPDGEKGPLASSLEAHRRYYAKRALLWERQAMLKARFVAGDAELGQQFLRLLHEFVYGRSLTPAEWGEIRHMRQRIEQERGDPAQRALEFKTGPGGLIDIEFLIQALQLGHGHAQPTLRTAHTLAALNRLTALGLVEDDDSYQLRRHYLFLRRIELTLRRVENVSVSRLPADAAGQRQVARRLGYADATELMAEYRAAAQRVRAIYDRLMAQ